jgi:hypothetical protein
VKDTSTDRAVGKACGPGVLNHKWVAIWIMLPDREMVVGAYRCDWCGTDPLAALGQELVRYPDEPADALGKVIGGGR